jgi:hypothetical protein
MNTPSFAFLQVCLFAGLSFSASAATPAVLASAAVDVPASARTADTVNRNLDKPIVARTDNDILERARLVNEDVYSALQSFVCNEEINRFRGNLTGQSVKPLDKVTAKLSFERGVEQYSDVYQNNRQRPGISSLVGAWSEGEYGTLLIQTQQLLSTQKVEFETFADVKGEQTAVYRFDVASEDSPWDLEVAGHHYRLAFTTKVWIAVNSGEILKIDRTSLGIAPETRISEIQWGITLDRVGMNGKTWLLPTTGTYAVLYNEAKRKEWNTISFSNYRRYGAETALKFD